MYTLSLDLYIFSCERRIQYRTTVEPFLLLMLGRSVNFGADIWYARVFFAFNYFGSEAARDRVNRFPPISYVPIAINVHITNGKRETQLEIRVSLQIRLLFSLEKIVHCKFMGVGIITRPSGIKLSFELSLFLCVICAGEEHVHIFMACSATVYLHFERVFTMKTRWVGVEKLLASCATS